QRQRRHQREHLNAQRIGLDAVLLRDRDRRQVLAERRLLAKQHEAAERRGAEDVAGGPPRAHRRASACRAAPASPGAPSSPGDARPTLNTPAGLIASSSSAPRASTSTSRSPAPSGRVATTLSGPLWRAAAPSGVRFSR